MPDQDVALMAHLLRRAGFGASRDEIEAKAAEGYEATVGALLDPQAQPSIDEDLNAPIPSHLLSCRRH